MNQVKTLLEKAPFICRCEDPGRISLILTAIYDATKNNGNAFDPTEKDFNDPEQRLKYIDLTNDFWKAKDKNAAKKIMALLNICMISGWRRKRKITESQYTGHMQKFLDDAYLPNQEIDQILNIESARSTWWWG